MCKPGIVTELIIPKYMARLKGIDFEVDNAKIDQCDSCGERYFHPKEIRRWEKILKAICYMTASSANTTINKIQLAALKN